MRPPFSEVRRRLETHQGELFRAPGRRAFTYRIHGDRFLAGPADAPVDVSDVERAYRGERDGGALVAAVLADPRIRRGDW